MISNSKRKCMNLKDLPLIDLFSFCSGRSLNLQINLGEDGRTQVSVQV